MIYGCQTYQEAVFLDLSSLPSGLGGPNSWDQTKASCLGEEGGQEWPTSEEQASRGQPARKQSTLEARCWTFMICGNLL